MPQSFNLKESLAQFGNKLKKVVNNDWTITLSATMIGVFAGIYLNNIVAAKSLQNQAQSALTTVEQELAKNHGILQESYNAHKNFLDVLSFLNASLNEKNHLVTKLETMRSFKSKHPGIFSVTDSVALNDELYRYEGEMNFDFTDMPSISISNIAWTTIENSQLTSAIAFDCLYSIASINKIQKKVIGLNEALYEFFGGKKDMGPKFKYILAQLRQTLQFEEILLEVYNQNKELTNC
jgi:hypothetical protein